MQIYDTVAVVTGASEPIGRAVALELARRGVHGLALADSSIEVLDLANDINSFSGDWICTGYQGDISDESFRSRVFRETTERCGRINVCVPAFGCADSEVPSIDTFQQTRTALNWAMKLVCEALASRTDHGDASSPTGLIFFIQLAPSALSSSLERQIDLTQIRKEAAVLATLAERLGIKYAVMLPTPGAEPPSWFSDSGPLGRDVHSDSIARAICFLIPALTK